MRAEAEPWRCRRYPVAAAPSISGLKVLQIVEDGKTSDRKMAPYPVVEENRILGPPNEMWSF